jgi:tRNA modification GTPase
MSYDHDTTIVALATPLMASGVAIIRISGSKVKTLCNKIFKGAKSPLEYPSKMCYGQMIDSTDPLQVLDQGYACYFPAPKTFTGEDILELHIHGNVVLAQLILKSIYYTGVLPAEPGEFTKRSFLNGKIDLVQAEAINDLINAQNEVAVKLANEQLNGRLSTAIDNIGEPLRVLLAELEAIIDFPEEDIDPDNVSKINNSVIQCKYEIEKLLATYHSGRVIREGFRILLCGPPNAGKSSLMNLMVGSHRAITSPKAGTTRDLIEERITLDGIPILLCDSAGITDTTCEIEQQGIELTFSRLSWADLIIVVVDSQDNITWDKLYSAIYQENREIWLIANKCELQKIQLPNISSLPYWWNKYFAISVKNNIGITELANAIIEVARENNSDIFAINDRQRLCLDTAKVALTRFIKNCSNANIYFEILAEDIRIALNALQDIVGRTYTEDILGRIFTKFCIGK